jgi:hypothetical protein
VLTPLSALFTFIIASSLPSLKQVVCLLKRITVRHLLLPSATQVLPAQLFFFALLIILSMLQI